MKPVLYDVLRLFIGPWFVAPRGIDRVDLAFAQHLFDDAPGEVIGVMPTPWGVRMFDRARVQKGLARLVDIWQETVADPARDPVLARIKAQFAGAYGPGLPRQASASAWRRQARMLAATGLPLGRAVRHAPRDALYLNIGQLGWAAPIAMGWLQQRRDIACVVMLHDAIALRRPELFSAFGQWSQRTMVREAACRMDGLIATTESARAEVTREIEAIGGAVRRDIALPLPLAQGFLAPDSPDSVLAGESYFVVCGAIEARKNHAQLLRLWPRLPGARLVIVGSPARGMESILAKLRATPGVIHAQGLSTPALRVLLRHSQALLMPSVAEGFGLPVQEALSLGVPVIASDIAAHREIAQGRAKLLPADDDAAWLMALQSPPPRPVGYRPMSGEEYFRRIDEFLDGF